MHELVVGLNVLNDSNYTAYRAEMQPILNQYGGGFGYDFKVSEVLKSATPDPINRVFTIYFPDASKMDAFFSDPAYLKVKAEHFDASVNSTTIIAAYDR